MKCQGSVTLVELGVPQFLGFGVQGSKILTTRVT